MTVRVFLILPPVRMGFINHDISVFISEKIPITTLFRSLAHNHISGLALPSQADLTTTRRLRAVLREVGVELSDHLIFADDDMVSLRDSGLFEWYGAEPPDF